MASLIVASSSEANAKVLRYLAQSVEKLPSNTNEIHSTASLLEHCIQLGALTSVSSDDAAELISNTKIALSSNHPDVVCIALRLTSAISRSFPRTEYAQHWYPLTQCTLNLFKNDNLTAASDQPIAQLFSTCAALVHAAAPIARLGGEHKARAISIAKIILKNALQTLETKAQSGPFILAVLSSLWAVCAAAPRELRSVIAQLDGILKGKLFIHVDYKVRQSAATMYAHIVTVIPEKSRVQSVADRISLLCTDMEDVLNILDAHGAQLPGSEANVEGVGRWKPLKQERLNAMHVGELSSYFSSICLAAVESLSVCLPALVPVPLPGLTRLLCNALIPRSMDPYAPGLPGSKLGMDSSLAVVTSVTRTGLSSLRKVLWVVDRDALMPLCSIICDAIQGRLKWLLLQTRKEKGIIATLRIRMDVYELVTDAIMVLGGAVVDEVAVMLLRLMEKDVSFLLEVLKHRNRDNTLFLSGTDTALDSTVRGKKRRRQDARRSGDHGANGKEDVETTLVKLQAVLDEPSGDALKEAVDFGMRVAQACFECRGILKERTTQHLREIEYLIVRCLENQLKTKAIIAAAAASAVSGGSNRMEAYISPAFESCARAVSDLCVSGNVQEDARKSAVTGRSMCEGIVHPKGPPTRPALIVSAPVIASAENASVSNKSTGSKGSNVLPNGNSGPEKGNKIKVLGKNKDPKSGQFVFNVRRGEDATPSKTNKLSGDINRGRNEAESAINLNIAYSGKPAGNQSNSQILQAMKSSVSPTWNNPGDQELNESTDVIMVEVDEESVGRSKEQQNRISAGNFVSTEEKKSPGRMAVERVSERDEKATKQDASSADQERSSQEQVKCVGSNQDETKEIDSAAVESGEEEETDEQPDSEQVNDAVEVENVLKLANTDIEAHCSTDKKIVVIEEETIARDTVMVNATDDEQENRDEIRTETMKRAQTRTINETFEEAAQEDDQTLEGDVDVKNATLTSSVLATAKAEVEAAAAAIAATEAEIKSVSAGTAEDAPYVQAAASSTPVVNLIESENEVEIQVQDQLEAEENHSPQNPGPEERKKVLEPGHEEDANLKRQVKQIEDAEQEAESENQSELDINHAKIDDVREDCKLPLTPSFDGYVSKAQNESKRNALGLEKTQENEERHEIVDVNAANNESRIFDDGPREFQQSDTEKHENVSINLCEDNNNAQINTTVNESENRIDEMKGVETSSILEDETQEKKPASASQLVHDAPEKKYSHNLVSTQDTSKDLIAGNGETLSEGNTGSNTEEETLQNDKDTPDKEHIETDENFRGGGHTLVGKEDLTNEGDKELIESICFDDPDPSEKEDS